MPAPALQGAAINVDVGLGTLVREDCGADLEQPGVWNRYGIDSNGHQVLVDTAGRETSAVLETTDVATWVACHTDQPGGNQDLLGDGAQTMGTDQVWRLSGLEPGQYLLVVYGRAGCTAGPTEITVTGDRMDQACEGRATRADEAWGSHFVIETSQGVVEIRLSPSALDSEVRLSGLQIQPVGSGSVALLSVGSQTATLLSEGAGPLSAPSCAPMASRSEAQLILRGGPVGLDSHLIEPCRAPIQTVLSAAGWHPEPGPPHAEMQWAGMQFWWQLAARDGEQGSTAWLWRDGLSAAR
jgi:hypothetical protein